MWYLKNFWKPFQLWLNSGKRWTILEYKENAEVRFMTIKDLATMTGYSVGTVSRVLNNHPNVSDTARETILRAVEECGFHAARGKA